MVAYLPDDPTHQFLDEIAESQTVFQVIIQYQLDLEESQITYAIVNGYVTGTQLSGDKDQVVTKSYSFTPADVVARVMTMAAPLPVYQGDYGVGANTTGITAKYNAQAIDISNQNAQQLHKTLVGRWWPHLGNRLVQPKRHSWFHVGSR